MADIKATYLGLEELRLIFTEQSCKTVDLEVDDLSTLYIYDYLPRVGASLENAALIRIPFCFLSVLTAALDLDQTPPSHLDENVPIENLGVQRLFIRLEPRVFGLVNAAPRDLEYIRLVLERHNDVLVMLILSTALQGHDRVGHAHTRH